MSAESKSLADQPSEADVPTKKLNARQTAFVAEYLIDLNGTQAAIRAGYSPTSAAESACEFLKDSNIAAAIERGKAQRLSRVGLKQEDVLNEMSALALSRIEHYVVDDEGQVQLAEGAPDNAMAAIQSIKRKTRVFYNKDGEITHKEYDVELKLWDKPGSLKLTGRHVGLYADRVEVTGKNGEPIVARVLREIVDAGDQNP